jgi:hypothetical protein
MYTAPQYFNQLISGDILSVIISIMVVGISGIAAFVGLILAFLYLEEKKSPWK